MQYEIRDNFFSSEDHQRIWEELCDSGDYFYVDLDGVVESEKYMPHAIANFGPEYRTQEELDAAIEAKRVEYEANPWLYTDGEETPQPFYVWDHFDEFTLDRVARKEELWNLLVDKISEQFPDYAGQTPIEITSKRILPNEVTCIHHKDTEDDSTTFLYFVNTEWHRNTNGILEFFNEEDKTSVGIYPIPNRIVRYPGNQPHKDHSFDDDPLTMDDDIDKGYGRITISIRYERSYS